MTDLIPLLTPLATTQQLVLWAADCAERVLPAWEAAYPHDKRPHEAVAAARSGVAANAANAARAAVRAANAANAAYTAARAAARAAVRAAYAARAADAAYAAYAAYAATRAADAAYDARAAAKDSEAEYAWQLDRLLSYLMPDSSADQRWALCCAVRLGADPVTLVSQP